MILALLSPDSDKSKITIVPGDRGSSGDLEITIGISGRL